jgi:DNA-binding transcriptional ArsR family regulator
LRVAKLACKGLCYKEIARATNKKRGTVQQQLKVTYQKLGVQDKFGLMMHLFKVADELSFISLFSSIDDLKAEDIKCTVMSS